MTPDRLYIDKEDRKLYERLEREKLFSKQSRREQFLLAMSVGFRNDLTLPLEKRDGFFLAKDLRLEDEALMKAVALHKSELSVLEDRASVFRLAEEYAHAGIRLLVNDIESTSMGSFDKAFELQTHSLLERSGLGENSIEEDHPSGA